MQFTPKFSAASWIISEPNVVAIPSNDFVTVDLYITAPKDVSGCGHYAIAYFQPNIIGKKTPSDKGSMAITAKIGSLINISVKDKNQVCKESVNFSQISAPKFLEYGPIKVAFDLINSGDIHMAPKGIATLTNFTGDLVDQKTITDQRIFPESAKAYEVQVGSKWMFGKYKVNLLASYGDKNQTLAKSIYVWVFPWTIALIVFLALIIILIVLKTISDKYSKKEAILEEEVKEEKEEIEKLKEQLKKRQD
jgi:hypothetical protein